MKRKLKLAILFGGKSAEHEVSLVSAKNIANAIDRKKYQIVPIVIDKNGEWLLDRGAKVLGQVEGVRRSRAYRSGLPVALVPGRSGARLVALRGGRNLGGVDVVFPVLHGTFGEDGTVQGLLKLANVPFVGAGVLGSAVGMDKEAMKRLLRDAGIPIAKSLVWERSSNHPPEFEQAKERLGLPLFIKPANLGSSVGISKARGREEFDRAVKEAFKYDSKILIEEFIQGREIECSVLGNDRPVASLPGEIIPQHDFYSYEAKYLDDKGAILKIPAELPDSIVREIQELSVRAFKALYCEGMARVDFFLRNDRELFVNEINTIPGFTQISMYPKLWEVSGLPYPKLIDRLIQLALERFKREKGLKTSFAPS